MHVIPVSYPPKSTVFNVFQITEKQPCLIFYFDIETLFIEHCINTSSLAISFLHKFIGISIQIFHKAYTEFTTDLNVCNCFGRSLFINEPLGQIIVALCNYMHVLIVDTVNQQEN